MIDAAVRWLTTTVKLTFGSVIQSNKDSNWYRHFKHIRVRGCALLLIIHAVCPSLQPTALHFHCMLWLDITVAHTDVTRNAETKEDGPLRDFRGAPQVSVYRRGRLSRAFHLLSVPLAFLPS